MLPQLASRVSGAQTPKQEQEQKETSVQSQETNKKLNKEEVLSKLLPVISMLGKIKQPKNINLDSLLSRLSQQYAKKGKEQDEV